MMTLQDNRFDRQRQHEAVGGYGPSIYQEDPRRFKYFPPDMASMNMNMNMNMAIPQPPPGFGLPPPMPAPGPAPPPTQFPFPPHSVPHTVSPPPTIPAIPTEPPPPRKPEPSTTLDEDFSNLSLKRVSKALKLISPKTNTPLSKEEIEKESSLAESSGMCRSWGPGSERRRLMPAPMKLKGLDSVATDGAVSLVSPRAGIPSGSRLRMWMGKTGGDGSSVDGTDESVDGVNVGVKKGVDAELGVVDPAVDLGIVNEPFVDAQGGVPRRSRLWRWMGKEGDGDGECAN